MGITDLFTEELKQLAPLNYECESSITPEIISAWAIELGKKAFESDESMSGGEG